MHDVIYNDFVVIGPPNDPAKVKGKSLQPMLSIKERDSVHHLSPGETRPGPTSGSLPSGRRRALSRTDSVIAVNLEKYKHENSKRLWHL